LRRRSSIAGPPTDQSPGESQGRRSYGDTC
jgi:hypothetical protein